MGARSLAFLVSLSLLCSPLAWAQESPRPELADELRGILRRYESSTADLRSRIAELESLLSGSEARSTSLLADLSASREALSSLASQYALLATRLDEYRSQLEASRRQTMSSLDSLTASMASMRARSLVQGSGIAVLVVAVALLVAR